MNQSGASCWKTSFALHLPLLLLLLLPLLLPPPPPRSLFSPLSLSLSLSPSRSLSLSLRSTSLSVLALPPLRLSLLALRWISPPLSVTEKSGSRWSVSVWPSKVTRTPLKTSSRSARIDPLAVLWITPSAAEDPLTAKWWEKACSLFIF